MDAQINTAIVGNRFRPIECQARFKALKPDEELYIVRQPDNEFDPNAIQVWTGDRQHFLGFIPKDIASFLAPHLDDGTQFHVTYFGDGAIRLTELEPDAA